MKIKSRLTHYILLGLIVASTLTATLSPMVSALIPTDPTTTTTASGMGPTELATSWQYYNALSYCISKAMLPSWPIHDSITEADAKVGKWFYNALGSSYQAPIGYFLADTGLKTDGKGLVDCGGDNVDWVPAAAKLWGYTDTISLLCDSGAARKNGSDCHDGSGDFTSTTRNNKTQLSLAQFRKNVGGKIYGGSTPSLTQPSYYPLYQKSFFAGCLGNTSPSPYTGSATDSFVYDITVVDAKGGTSTVHYYGIRQQTERIDYAVNTDLSIATKTCQDLAQQMNNFANAYSLYLTQSPAQQSQENTQKSQIASAASTGSKSSCAIQGIGWIICPVVTLLANVSDGAFGFLSNNFLKTNTAIIDTSSPTYTAWTTMRSIANIAFVIVFMIIIFSQISNIGISNYGVKKMLPRLIIAAILVNISYYICQVAVDLSNILGFSLKGMFDNIINASLPSTTSSISTGQGFAGVAGGILAFAGAAAIGYALLATLIPVILAAVVALVMILFILVARQALIVLLIVISPLAFVAFLLPNTEDWFKKWQKTFTAMLFLFPIVAVVFGASTLASNILTNTFSANFPGDTSASAMFGQLIGSLVLILPLFVVPGLLKKSLDSVGSLGTRIGNIGSKLSGAAAKKGSQGYENSRIGQFKKYKSSEANLRRAKVQSGAYKGRGGKLNPYNLLSMGNKYLNQKPVLNNPIAGKFGQRSAAMGISLVNKEESEEVQRAMDQMNSTHGPTKILGGAAKEFESAVKSGDAIKARAAAQILMTNGAPGLTNLRNTIAGIPETDANRNVLDEVRGDVKKAGLKPKDNILATWSYTKAPISVIQSDPKTLTDLTPAELAGQDAVILRTAAIANRISPEMATQILSNDNIVQSLSSHKIETLTAASTGSGASLPPPAPPSPPTPTP